MKKTRTFDEKVAELESLFAEISTVEFDKQSIDDNERTAARILVDAGFYAAEDYRLDTLTLFLDYDPDEDLADYRHALEGLVDEITRRAILREVDAEALFDEFAATIRDRAVDAEL